MRRWLAVATIAISCCVRGGYAGWRPFVPLRQARYGAGAVVVGDSLLVIGGEATWHHHRTRRLSTVEVLDGLTGTWRYGEPLPEPRAFFGLGTIGDTIFVFGGIDSAGQMSDDVFVFYPDSGEWIHVGDMPFPLSHFSTVRLGNSFFLFGGWLESVGNFNPYIFVFDPSTNTWDSIVIPAWVPRIDMAAAAIGDTAFLFGGIYFGQLNWVTKFFNSTVMDFDTLPMAISGMAITHMDGIIYLISGNSGGNEQSVGWYFVPSSQQWGELPDLISSRSYATAAVFENNLFVIGGRRCDWTMRSVEVLELQSIEEEGSGRQLSKFKVFAPNPLTYESRITIVAPHEAELSVYSANGSLVLRRRLHEGVNSLVWKPIGLPSGVYFYKIGDEGGRWLYLRR
ncbi:MAG: hypothetical protein DRQ10_02165 [Candidatus Hydrothermota bacterium]|nr:MAG: hypothetical protein DRQ10_02165 [Candidatus Hydrothermae bacterium]